MHQHGPQAGNYQTFARIYKKDYRVKLRFRKKRQHKICSVSARYKLLSQSLSHDNNQRSMRLGHDQRHLNTQDWDTQTYRQHRDLSRS